MSPPDFAGLQWRKSTYSNGNGECVEIAGLHAGTAVRDSKLGNESPILSVSRSGWLAVLHAAKAGKLDLT